MHELEQHPVGIAMHDAVDRRMGVIADRIGAFARRARQFPDVRNDTAARSDRRDRRDRSARRPPASPPPHSARRPVPAPAMPRPAPGHARPVRRAAATSRRAADCVRSWLTRRRRPHHLIDPGRAARQHHQPVEAERDAAGLRHLRRPRRENPRRADSARRSAAASRPSLGSKRRRCSAGVGQFAKAVGEFDAAGIELEALGDPRIGRLWPAPAPPPAPDIRTASSNAPAPAAARHVRPAPC